MVDARWLTALLGIALSVAISVLAWAYFDTFLLFLLVPFVPFLFGRRSRPETKRCPECGFETDRTEFDHCPRDGTRLQ